MPRKRAAAPPTAAAVPAEQASSHGDDAFEPPKSDANAMEEEPKEKKQRMSLRQLEPSSYKHWRCFHGRRLHCNEFWAWEIVPCLDLLGVTRMQRSELDRDGHMDDLPALQDFDALTKNRHWMLQDARNRHAPLLQTKSDVLGILPALSCSRDSEHEADESLRNFYDEVVQDALDFIEQGLHFRRMPDVPVTTDTDGNFCGPYRSDWEGRVLNCLLLTSKESTNFFTFQDPQAGSLVFPQSKPDILSQTQLFGDMGGLTGSEQSVVFYTFSHNTSLRNTPQNLLKIVGCLSQGLRGNWAVCRDCHTCACLSAFPCACVVT